MGSTLLELGRGREDEEAPDFSFLEGTGRLSPAVKNQNMDLGD